MNNDKIIEIFERQKKYFAEGKTLNVAERKRRLTALREAVEKNADRIAVALKADLGKSPSESYMCETGLSLSEITYQIKHIKKFAKRQRVTTPMAQWIAKSYRYPSPYGTVLVMSPWNYPILLSLDPVAEAVAAGNTVILKPSAYSPASSAVLRKIISEALPEEVVAVVEGGREENKILLDLDFDYIFFTGSKTVGRQVYEKAASRLTPVTLELGGKSPCIVDATANIPLAARRIVFGKYLNCGQTCVAPDYILCHTSVKDRFIEEVKKQIVAQYGANPLKNENYGRIVSKKHFDRVAGLIDAKKVVFGGQCDEEGLRIAPTVMDGVTPDDKVMGEEIFGPIMPVLTYDNLDEVIKAVNGGESPLAAYYFSTDKKSIEKFLAETRFGGGCINDVIIHLATSYMPFGGFGESGLGSYHGKTGFDTFTHYKSIVDKKNITDLPMRYQPYNKFYDFLIRMFVR